MFSDCFAWYIGIQLTVRRSGGIGIRSRLHHFLMLALRRSCLACGHSHMYCDILHPYRLELRVFSPNIWPSLWIDLRAWQREAQSITPRQTLAATRAEIANQKTMYVKGKRASSPSRVQEWGLEKTPYNLSLAVAGDCDKSEHSSRGTTSI